MTRKGIWEPYILHFTTLCIHASEELALRLTIASYSYENRVPALQSACQSTWVSQSLHVGPWRQQCRVFWGSTRRCKMLNLKPTSGLAPDRLPRGMTESIHNYTMVDAVLAIMTCVHVPPQW